MRAVNLVPAELRGAGGPSRSGGAVYVLLAGLAAAVICVVAVTLLGREVAERETVAVALEADAQRAETRAAAVSRYERLAAETAGKVARIRKVADGRVDWSKPLAELAGFIGDEVYFDSLSATVSPGASAGGEANPLRAAVASPALEVRGCARDHAAVARLIARLRAMDDVTRVSLSDSKRAEPEGPGAAPAPASSTDAGEEGADCTAVADRPATFSLVVFLDPTGTTAPAPGTATTTAATGSAG
jgi:Tfp pilus assembly protein PilN